MARGKKAAQGLTPEEKLAQALVPVEEQPYPIPENWCWAYLDKIYCVNPKNDVEEDADAAFIPMEKISAGMQNDYTFEIQPWKKAKKGHTQFADGDVAFAKISPCFENRKSMVAENLPNGVGGGTTELIILRQPKILSKYTFWLISDENFIQGGKNTYSGTVGQQRISMDYVRNYRVPLPPLAEQQRLVDRIESIFAKLDEAKEKAQAVVDGFELRKSAILHKAFMGELTAKWREEHGVTLDRWTKSTFSDVVDEFKYGLSEKSDYGYDGIPVFRIPNVTDNGLSFDDLKYLSHSQIDSSSLLRKDDVLIIRSNGSKELVGKSVLVPSLDKEYTYASFLIRARLNPKIVPAYFVYYINSSDARIQMFKKAKSSAGINNINSKELGAINILVCSVSEQSEIVRILDEFLDKENAAKEAAEAVLEQIDTMKKAVLARAFRGELGTNDPAEESAVELLKTML